MIAKMYAFNVIPYDTTYRATGRGAVAINVYKYVCMQHNND